MSEHLSAYVLAMQQLHRDEGMTSYRRLAAWITDRGHRVSHATVHEILNGTRLAGWAHTRAVVEALGGNPEEISPLWVQACAERRGGPIRNGSLVEQGAVEELRAIRELLERIAKVMGA